MTENPIIKQIKDKIVDGKLGQAISEAENALLSGQLQGNQETLSAIKNEYTLLTDYWRRGYSDNQRAALYNQMLQRLYVLTANMEQRVRLQGSPYLMNLYKRPRQAARNWSMAMIRKQLEDFVSNVALLELEPEHVGAAKEKELYESHQLWISDLFDYIVMSSQWSESIADAFIELLSAPTVDVRDQQLIVSAIMLSGMNSFDFEKLRVLMRVYQHATDEGLRQRALVGWVLCQDKRYQTLYPEQAALIHEICEDEHCRNELTELQMQLIYSLKTDADGRTIEKEIMPDIMKGSNLKLTRNGLEEAEEDQLESVLHPEKTEQYMEQMERRMQQMADMQKQGSDIYFHGFKLMKRFPFFQTLSNWFVPFFPQHPSISGIWKQNKYNIFLKTITKTAAFCDSDKYSFALGFDQIVDVLPQSILEMLERGQAAASPLGGIVPKEEQMSAAFKRRLYLQNMFRFARLFTFRSVFRNVFEDERALAFFTSSLFKGSALEQRFSEVVAFMLKRGFNDVALDVLNNTSEESRDYQFYILYARTAKYADHASIKPIDCYRMALELQPHDKKALRGFARESFEMRSFDDAAKAYDELLAADADNAALLLGKAACQANIGQCADALKVLYRLNYEQPDNHTVNSVLAWTLTEDHQFEQAMKIYNRLLQETPAEAEDYLNAAFCLWIGGRINEAVDTFLRFRELFNVDATALQEKLSEERERLSQHGIGDIDFRLMCEAVEGGVRS